MSVPAEPRHSPFGQTVTFRVGAPGVLLTSWVSVTGFVAMGCLAMAVLQPWGYGHPPGFVALFTGLVCFAAGPGMLIARSRRQVKWVRVRPENGLLLTTGEEVAWTDVLSVGVRRPLVEIRTRTIGLLTLTHMEDAARFEALVRRYKAAAHDRS